MIGPAGSSGARSCVAKGCGCNCTQAGFEYVAVAEVGPE